MNELPDAHRQTVYSLRMDWGTPGTEAIAPGCDVAVIIDVLSFTTTLTSCCDPTVVPGVRAYRRSRAVAEQALTFARLSPFVRPALVNGAVSVAARRR